jgi:two-component system, cell cycle sensor histidine kinase and response regulator CckA
VAQLLQDAHRKERRFSRGSQGRGRAVNGNKKENCTKRHPSGWRFFAVDPTPTCRLRGECCRRSSSVFGLPVTWAQNLKDVSPCCLSPITARRFGCVHNVGSIDGDLDIVQNKGNAVQSKIHVVRKRAPSVQILRDSEARYRRLFETAQDGILILDAKTGLITDVNPFLMQRLDYSREEFLGKALWEIGLFRDIEASKSAFLELKSKAYIRYDDLPLKTKGGRFISVEFVSNVYRVKRKKVIQCNIRDITERRRAERSEQLTQQAQKMETVGQLTGGIAHDFNNHLAVILGYCEMLEDRPDLSGPVRKMIMDIHSAGTSAKNLVRHLLTFSRLQVLHPVPLGLNATVSRLHSMLSRLIGDEVELVSVPGSDLGTIQADPIQVEQVLMNLAINSRDAMPQGGRITIETSNVESPDEESNETWVRHNPTAKLGPCVMLAVSDTGIGMDKETQARVFEPFFSTKEAGKGTGLGLSTVFGIVKQSAGAICVYSEPGHGTTFKIYFPRCEAAAAVSQRAKDAPPLGGSETILLVDDADTLRALTRQLLEGSGYTVLDTGQPSEALRIAEQHPGPLHLMITDVMMPGLCGPGLAEKLAAVRPETRVLYTSGCSADAVFKPGVHSSDHAFLEKPFTRDDLVRKVREVLDLDSPVHPSA